MHPKIKGRSIDGKAASDAAKTVMPDGAAGQTVSARRRTIAIQPASGTANHSRHHVSRRTQS